MHEKSRKKRKIEVFKKEAPQAQMHEKNEESECSEINEKSEQIYGLNVGAKNERKINEKNEKIMVSHG